MIITLLSFCLPFLPVISNYVYIGPIFPAKYKEIQSDKISSNIEKSFKKLLDFIRCEGLNFLIALTLLSVRQDLHILNVV